MRTGVMCRALFASYSTDTEPPRSKKVKLYSAVSGMLDRSKRFTLHHNIVILVDLFIFRHQLEFLRAGGRATLSASFWASRFKRGVDRRHGNRHFTELLLLFESLHDSRPMLGAGSSSGLNSSRSSWVHGCGRMGQTSRCFMVCSFPHSHVVCPSSLDPHFCIRDLHRPVPVRRRFRLDQVGHVSLEPGCSDSLGLKESLCGVVWRWLDQRVRACVHHRETGGNAVELCDITE